MQQPGKVTAQTNERVLGREQTAHGYQHAAHGYRQPAHVYQQIAAYTRPRYQQTAYGYQRTAHSYQQTAYGYHQMAHGYQKTAYGYQQTAPYTRPGYRQTAPGYQQKSPYTRSGYQQTSHGYQPTAHGYRQTAPGYQQTSNGYQQTSHGYQQTSHGYQQASHGYQQKAYGCQQTALVFRQTAPCTRPSYQQAAPGYQQTANSYQQEEYGFKQAAHGYQHAAHGYKQTAPGCQQTVPYTRPRSQQIALEAMLRYQQTELDFQQTATETRPYHQKATETRPYHQQTAIETRPFHQQTAIETGPYHQQTAIETGPYHQQTTIETRHQQTAIETRPYHQQTATVTRPFDDPFQNRQPYLTANTREHDLELESVRNYMQSDSPILLEFPLRIEEAKKCTEARDNSKNKNESAPKPIFEKSSINPGNWKSDLDAIGTWCFTCGTTVYAGEMLKHLFFGKLQCNYCPETVQACPLTEIPKVATKVCPKGVHDFGKWVEKPVSYLASEFGKYLNQFTFQRPNFGQGLDCVTITMRNYVHKLGNLEEKMPWKLAIECCKQWLKQGNSEEIIHKLPLGGKQDNTFENNEISDKNATLWRKKGKSEDIKVNSNFSSSNYFPSIPASFQTEIELQNIDDDDDDEPEFLLHVISEKTNIHSQSEAYLSQTNVHQDGNHSVISLPKNSLNEELYCISDEQKDANCSPEQCHFSEEQMEEPPPVLYTDLNSPNKQTIQDESGCLSMLELPQNPQNSSPEGNSSHLCPKRAIITQKDAHVMAKIESKKSMYSVVNYPIETCPNFCPQCNHRLSSSNLTFDCAMLHFTIICQLCRLTIYILPDVKTRSNYRKILKE